MMGEMDIDFDLLPCPFCGTHPSDEKYPVSMTQTGPKVTIECGKCGASWPHIDQSDLAEMDQDDVAAAWNIRSTTLDKG